VHAGHQLPAGDDDIVGRIDAHARPEADQPGPAAGRDRRRQADLYRSDDGPLRTVAAVGNPDPELRSVRPGRAAGGSDWIRLRRNEGIRWPVSPAAAVAEDPGGVGVPDGDWECLVA